MSKKKLPFRYYETHFFIKDKLIVKIFNACKKFIILSRVFNKINIKCQNIYIITNTAENNRISLSLSLG